MNKMNKDLLKKLKKFICKYKSTLAKKIKEKKEIMPWSEVYGQGNDEYGRKR